MAWGQETSEAQSQDSKWKFVIGAGYIFAPSIVEFNDLKYSDSNHNHGSGTASLQYGTTYSISLEVKKLPQHSWGVFGGLNYQGEREFEKGYIIVGGDYLDIAGGSGASRVQFSDKADIQSLLETVKNMDFSLIRKYADMFDEWDFVSELRKKI